MKRPETPEIPVNPVTKKADSTFPYRFVKMCNAKSFLGGKIFANWNKDTTEKQMLHDVSTWRQYLQVFIHF